MSKCEVGGQHHVVRGREGRRAYRQCDKCREVLGRSIAPSMLLVAIAGIFGAGLIAVHVLAGRAAFLYVGILAIICGMIIFRKQ